MNILPKAICLGLLLSASLYAEAQNKEEALYKPRKKESLLSRATVLHDRGKCIMVPKGSVLILPEGLKQKVVQGGPQGKLVKWKDFFSLNSSWLHRHEVTIEQARGDAKIDQEVFESLKLMNKIVIASHGDAITSVSPMATTYETEEN